ncbi:alpha-1,3-mannosyl-glycoprotein 2-beta-N-acetylglucosaminyltransferase-like [Haemaphysalis longicornis]
MHHVRCPATMNRLNALLLAGAFVWSFITGLIFLQLNQSRLYGLMRSQAVVLDQDVRSQFNAKDVGLDQLKRSKKAIDDSKNQEEVIAVLVLAFNRVSVKRALDQVIRFRPSRERFPVIVSQDGYHNKTSELLRQYQHDYGFFFMQQPDQTVLTEGVSAVFNIEGYYRIARHYKWALTQVFDHFKHTAVIVLEDDLDIAPDFFEYFASLLPILRNDPSLFCISAYNDNGKRRHISLSPDMLHRTDFFSGLGWLLTRELWQEIGPRWPKSFWDDWIRNDEQRKGRACIRPEVSRTRTFGRKGVSEGQFFDTYLRDVHLNDVFVRFSSMDLSYLHQSRYDQAFLAAVNESRLHSLEDLTGGRLTHSPSKIPYEGERAFDEIAEFLGIMNDFKAGVPRTAYKGVVSTYYEGIRLFLVPEPWEFQRPLHIAVGKSHQREVNADRPLL